MTTARLVRDRGVELEGIDSAFLDCVNDNIGVLLKFHGVSRVRELLGYQWAFGFDVGEALPLPTLHWKSIDRVIMDVAGFQLVPLESQDVPTACTQAVQRDDPVLAIGDAYAMPWLPYCGRQHMDHSFVIDGVDMEHHALHIADAYENATQWGDASPTRRWISRGDLVAMLDRSSGQGGNLFTLKRVGRQRVLDPRRMIGENAERMRASVGDQRAIRRFSDYYAERADDLESVRRFSVGCWLTVRARSLHYLWLQEVSEAHPSVLDRTLVPSFDRIVTAWRRVRDFAYVMERRVEMHRPPPKAAFKVLEESVETAETEWARLITEMLWLGSNAETD